MPKGDSPSTPLPTNVRVLRQFRIVFNAVRAHFQEMEKEVGLGGAQVWALSIIKANPGSSVGEVAKTMQIHQSTASNLIKALAQKELVRLEKSESDKRSVHLHILPDGARLLKKVRGPFEGVLPAALNQLSEPTLRRLDRDLGQLIGLLNADEAAAEKPLAQI